MLFTTPSALQCALVEKIGVASVILLPTKTVILLADISSLHGTILCFKALTLTLLNLTLTVKCLLRSNFFLAVHSHLPISNKWLERIARSGWRRRDSVRRPVVSVFVRDG